MRRITILGAVVLAAVSFLGGCATYVNIPPQPGDVARSDPNLENVRHILVPALRAVVADRPPEGPYRVVLPAGTLPIYYDMIVPRLDEQAVWGGEEDQAVAAAPVIEARQVRVRGWRAQVDILRPAPGAGPEGPSQVVTTYLKWDPINNWYVDRLRIWRMPAEDALRISIQRADLEGP